jgi:hypothetical protein
MTFVPGKKDVGSAGKHDRDLARDVRWLRGAYDLGDLALLVEDHELGECQIPDIGDVMAAHGIGLIRHPIRDRGVPSDGPALRRLLDDIRDRVARGHNVAVACRGGLGRTGTVVGCLLRDGGLDGSQAIALTRDTRRNTIDRGVQERFVETWGG